jgi:putative ABC transport system permease protein
VDRAQLAGLFERFKGIPRVAGVAERVQEIRAFNRVMDETMLFFTYVATVFAVVIAFGVIYNSARIALTERGRELASLRVLGFTRGEIAYILLGELAVLTLAAIPLGLVAGRWMCHYIASTMQNDLFGCRWCWPRRPMPSPSPWCWCRRCCRAWRCGAGSTNWTWLPS